MPLARRRHLLFNRRSLVNPRLTLACFPSARPDVLEADRLRRMVSRHQAAAGAVIEHPGSKASSIARYALGPAGIHLVNSNWIPGPRAATISEAPSRLAARSLDVDLQVDLPRLCSRRTVDRGTLKSKLQHPAHCSSTPPRAIGLPASTARVIGASPQLLLSPSNGWIRGAHPPGALRTPPVGLNE